MLFSLPSPLGNEIPLCDLHVWAWAKTQARANVKIENYLQSLGFVVGAHKIEPEQYDILHAAIGHFHRTAPHMQPARFSALFTKVETGGFWIDGKPGRYEPTPEVFSALVQAGWIYEITPDTTYFSIINGKVWAKYQKIIGSRSLCEIIEPETLRCTRITNNSSGNPRYVVHFLQCLPENLQGVELGEKYAHAVKLMRAADGRKYHNKQYGGGIVFTSYSIDELAEHIGKITGRQFVAVSE